MIGRTHWIAIVDDRNRTENEGKGMGEERINSWPISQTYFKGIPNKNSIKNVTHKIFKEKRLKMRLK